jgi:hypothetical protein
MDITRESINVMFDKMRTKIIDTFENFIEKSIDEIFEKSKYEKCIKIESLPKEIDLIEVCRPLAINGTIDAIDVEENNGNELHLVSMQQITGQPIRFKLELPKFEEDQLVPPEENTKNWEVEDEENKKLEEKNYLHSLETISSNINEQ